jgi:peptidyl-prolyl cis-trans isomerase SurA
MKKKTYFSNVSFYTFSALLFTLVPLNTYENKALASQNSAGSTFSEKTLDGIIVSVGEDIILLSELQKAIQQVSAGQCKLLSNGKLVGGSISAQDAENILEQLISQKILSLRVQELGLSVTEDELDQEISSLLKQQNMTQEDFIKALQAEGETVTSHREEFRKQLETQRFIGRTIRPLVTVSEDEIRNSSASQQGQVEEDKKITLRSLLVQKYQEKESKIQKIKEDLTAGKSFESIAKMHSEDPDVLKTSGMLPPRFLKDLPEELRKELPNKKKGDVIGPIQIGSSAFFFEYLAEETSATKNTPEATKNNQLNSKKRQEVEAKILDQKFKERLSEYLKAEKTKVKVTRRNFTISK